jgi:phosphotriesterase-related protein
MSSAGLSGLVQTVLGSVRPEELGPTTTHEHLLIDFLCMFNPPTEASERLKAFQPVTLGNLGWVRYDPFRNRDNLRLLDEDTAVSEALLYKRAGGGSMVDVTTIGIGRDPLALARISRSTGLHIVMGAGYYVDAVHPEGMDDRSDADLAREMVREITEGVDDTGVKAGIIGELGCTWPLTENERKVLRAGAQAQRETGAAILIHPGRNEAAPFEILDVLAEAGAEISRVVMGHLERTVVDEGPLIELARRGSYLEYDLFGWETSYYSLSDVDMVNDAQRLGFIKGLIDEGYADRIVIAQDICTKHRLVKYGGHGYSHILENIVPRMREKGISKEDIHAIIEANPARVLTLA